MKKTNSIFLLVFCLILIMLTGSASAQQCICLDEYGNVYPNETAATAICYQYNSDNVLIPTTTTFKQCRDINTAYAQKAEQERIRQQQTLEEQQRQQQALEEQQRQQALEEQQRQQALEEQQRQQALEEQQRQQVLEEQQRQQALEEQQRQQQILEEQQRQQALEE